MGIPFGMLLAKDSTLLKCALFCYVLFVTACATKLEYPVPRQKALPFDLDPPFSHPLVRLADPDADAFIAQDIARGNVGGQFRWTGARPGIKLWLDERSDREFYLFFGIIPSTFKDTGTVTIGILINGTKLAAPKFAAPGDYEFSQSVPKEILGDTSPTIVELEISPVYTAPPYGEKLGICLQTIGFRKRHQK